jgi:mannosyltransferase OCH1-like enzyme
MPIPRVFHQSSKTEDIPEEYRAYQRRLLDLHPDWDYRFYDDVGCRSIVERFLPSYIPVYDSYPTNIQRADSFRIIAVYAFGGFYLDLDVECLKSLDDLCEYNCVLAEERTLTIEETQRLGHKHAVRIANFMFGSEPRHPFLLSMLEAMVMESQRSIRTEQDVLESSGPGLMTRVYFNCRESLKDVVLLSNRDRTCPSPYCCGIACHFGDYAKHYHRGSWRWENAHGSIKAVAREKRNLSQQQFERIHAEIRAERQQVSLPEPVFVLRTHREHDCDGLGAVFHRVSRIGIVTDDTIQLSNKKVLVSGIPFLYLDRVSSSNTNVVYTTFESTELPRFWVDAINNAYDYCIVPHEYIKAVFENSGVQIPIEVIHQGFTRYKRGRRNLNIDRGFRVGFLGVPVRRKNLLKLAQACSDLMETIPQIKLVVHVSHYYDWMDTSEIETLRSAPFVEWSEGCLSEDSVAEWYRDLSCLVFPTSAEGWSFTPRESLYLGVPTILTDIPVHGELVASGYCRVIPVSGYEDAKFESHIFGQWHKIEVEDIARSILDAYQGYGAFHIKALKGSQWIENKWRNERTQQDILKFFKST